jgi:hypothetical protein
MRIDQFEDDRERREAPWRKYAPPVNKQPTNPNYPSKPFNHDEWMKSSKPMEESSEVPEVGDTIRTRQMEMEGKIEKINGDEVLFRIADGRLMKTSAENVIVVEKLADEDTEVMEDQLDEVSTELLAKYKTAAGKDATAADKAGDTARGNKRFHGIVQATKKQFNNDSKKKTDEGSMGGINRCAPAQDVSYEHMLDELSVGKMQAYKDAAQ